MTEVVLALLGHPFTLFIIGLAIGATILAAFPPSNHK